MYDRHTNTFMYDRFQFLPLSLDNQRQVSRKMLYSNPVLSISVAILISNRSFYNLKHLCKTDIHIHLCMTIFSFCHLRRIIKDKF